MVTLDLQNLSKDPATEANTSSKKIASDSETEDDAIQAEALRREKVRRLFLKQTDQTKN